MAEKLTTALILLRSHAAWTSLRDKKGDVEVAEQVDAPIELAADAETTGPEMTAQLKSRCSGVKGNITLVLPTSSTLMRVVELPSTDPEEIRSMAELQMDKFAPFPVDQMCVGHEVLAQTEDRSRVLVAAAPRGTVDAIGATFFQAGILPQSIDVVIMGWWWLLKAKGHVAETGRELFLIVDDDATELVVSQDGTPVLIRALAAIGVEAAAAAKEIAEETIYTLTTIETEWGAGHVDKLHVWHGEKISPEFLRELSAASEVDIDFNELKKLPPLSEGLARRIHERRGAVLDLAPAEWKASAISREARKRITIIAVTLLAIWMMAVGALFVYSQHEQDTAVFAKNELQRLDKKAGEVRELQKQVQSLQRYADRSYSALECLREICMLMPPGPELDALNYEKYNQVSLRGVADGDGPILDFFKQLQTSKFFPKVEPGGLTSVMKNNRPRSQFKATISLPEEKKPAEEKKK
jgi:Tfp pilus assembly protein PilN